MMGEDFENPFGQKLKNGNLKKMSTLLDSAVFPGNQGGPLEHIIAAKAVAFGEALSDEFLHYMVQVKKNAITSAKVRLARWCRLRSRQRCSMASATPSGPTTSTPITSRCRWPSASSSLPRVASVCPTASAWCSARLRVRRSPVGAAVRIRAGVAPSPRAAPPGSDGPPLHP